MSPRIVVLLLLSLQLLCAVALSEPVITGVAGCGSSADTACRPGAVLQVNGTDFLESIDSFNSLSIGGVSGRRYPCTRSYTHSSSIAFCYVPKVDPIDQGVALTVRQANGTRSVISNDYEGVYLADAPTIHPLASLLSHFFQADDAPEPVITGVSDCGYSLESACRAGNRLQLSGVNFLTLRPGIDSLSFGGVTGKRYPCTFSYANVPDTAYCFVPDVDPIDQGVPLTVHQSNGSVMSNDYGGVWLAGALSVSSISGCSGSEGGFPTGCFAGDSVTVQGSGFGYAQPGTDNLLGVSLRTGAALTDVEVQSNYLLTATLPTPFDFKSYLYLTAGQAPVASTLAPVTYTPVPTINGLRPVSGCSGSKVYNAPLTACKVGDVIDVSGPPGGFVGPLSEVVIGSSYNCLNPVFNATQTGIRCQLPQVGASDRGVMLQVTVVMETGDVSNSYSGLTYATATRRQMSKRHARLKL